ncbi:MAG: peptidoglycan-binding protein [Treponema sp.]|nr:peptidoglycan-binding protein [Treponema sp.]
MNCVKIMNMIYEEDSIPLLSQIQISLHTFFCHDCAREFENYQAAMAVMKNDFFPPPAVSWQEIEDSIMAKIHLEQIEDDEKSAETRVPGVPSTRGWIIAGLVLMVSLVTAFFGFDFQNLANESGTSFLLPMGITIGVILTIYGALFIGSNLKELSERFGL